MSEIVERPRDQCRESKRDDGGHAWQFDGDDPYIICMWCDRIQDALTGRVIREGSLRDQGQT